MFGEVYNQGSFWQWPGKNVYRYLYLYDAGGRPAMPIRAAMMPVPDDTMIAPNSSVPAPASDRQGHGPILFDFGLAAAAINVLK